jgi:hypothetical protein
MPKCTIVQTFTLSADDFLVFRMHALSVAVGVLAAGVGFVRCLFRAGGFFFFPSRPLYKHWDEAASPPPTTTLAAAGRGREAGFFKEEARRHDK